MKSYIPGLLVPRVWKCISRHIGERGYEVKVSSIARLLNIRQPSVVNMLHKLNEENFVEYSKENIAIRIT
ncbi:MAG: hypothetical protein ACRD5E_09065, partial [Nitrososphaeraceae archaeon]